MSEPRVSQRARPIRIILVEDDADDAELVRARFTEAGLHCQLERVESSPTFRAALGRGAVDLVIADYSLPRFDGLAVLELVRELRPDVPVVLISGVIDEDLAIETLKLGATDYVLKQRLDRLVPVVLRALREREVRRRTFLELREAAHEVRDCAAVPGSAMEATLDVAITQLELLLARALGEAPRA